MKKILKFSLVLIVLFNINTASISSNAPSSFADLAEQLMPSVVNISTTTTVVTKTNPFPNFQFPPGSPFEDMFKEFGTPQERKASALGSGFIIDKNGTVVTNNHVIKDADDILVRVSGDKEYKAKIIGKDPLSDIAVLKIDSDDTFKPVKFGNSDIARIGDWVLAIGNPFGLGGTVTSGIISARNRSLGLSRYEDFIQTDASINQGNSGGPLFNMDGEVVGVNTAILSQGGSIGIGFAIPSNNAKQVVDQLIKYGETKNTVNVGSRDNTDSILIWVSDTGPGIQDKDKEKVLNRFTRLDTSRNTSGTGLGLSLVTSMVKFHKGTIELLDAKPNGLIVKLLIPSN